MIKDGEYIVLKRKVEPRIKDYKINAIYFIKYIKNIKVQILYFKY